MADDYDDPAFSGGNMERPALRRLMSDIETCKIDVVVIYKIDRLTRSLADFSKMVEVFERHGVSFVSVTQQFNTTTSMGRLMLNILLSFAHSSVRSPANASVTRSPPASAKVCGWAVCLPSGTTSRTADWCPTNARPNSSGTSSSASLNWARDDDGQGTEARRRDLKAWTTQDGKTREGKPIDKGLDLQGAEQLTYLGELRHKEQWYQAEHPPIITAALWDQAHAILHQRSCSRQRDAGHCVAPPQGHRVRQ